MAIRQVVLSDISGTEVTDENHARLVIEHPDFPNKLLELDVTTEEADKFQNTALRLVNVSVYAPNQPPRKATVETRILDKLFDKVDFNKVLEGARVADAPKQSASGGGRGRKAAAPKSGGAGKLDYTAPENFGIIHRGKVTDEEARLVRENIEQANKNRARVGQPPVGEDPKDAQRYGLK